MIENLIPTLVTVLVAIVGYCFAYQQITEQKKKDIITKYLIEAWTKLVNASQRGINNPYKQDIEASIAAIMLFGDKEQNRLAKEFMHKLNQGHNADLTELLQQLRQDLRKELNLPKNSIKFEILRLSSTNH